MAGESSPRITRGFDRLAPFYDLLATAGMAGQIHRSQVALLPLTPRAKRALVLGGGTGRFLAEAMERGSVENAVSIEASGVMTRLTERRLGRLGVSKRVDLRVGDLALLDGQERFDLIVTHCYLDLFEQREMEDVVVRLDEVLAPGGRWLFSDFAAPGPGLAGLGRRALVSSLYFFFRATCGIRARRLPDFDRAFQSTGLETAVAQRLAAGLLRADLLIKP